MLASNFVICFTHTRTFMYERKTIKRREKESTAVQTTSLSPSARDGWLGYLLSISRCYIVVMDFSRASFERRNRRREEGKKKGKITHDFPRTSSRLSFGGCTLSTVPRLSFFEGGSSKVVWGDLIDSPSAPRTLPPDHSIYFGAEPLANIISRFPYERTSLSPLLSTSSIVRKIGCCFDLIWKLKIWKGSRDDSAAK